MAWDQHRQGVTERHGKRLCCAGFGECARRPFRPSWPWDWSPACRRRPWRRTPRRPTRPRRPRRRATPPPPPPTDTTPAPDPTPTETTPAPEPSPTETTAKPSPTTTSGTSSPTKSAPKPTVQPGPVAPAGSSGYVEVLDLAPLRGSFLAAQIAAADRITATLMASTSKVAVATREMDQLAAKSNALLESLAAARETERAATDEAGPARADLVVLEARLETARQILREWVFSVYSGGGGDSDIAGDARRHERRARGRSATRWATCPTSPSSAPGPSQDVQVLTAEQVRLSAAADAGRGLRRDGDPVIQRDKAAARQGRSSSSAPGSASCASCRSPRSRRPGPSRASSSAPAAPQPRAAAAQRLRDALRAAVGRHLASASRARTTTTATPTGCSRPARSARSGVPPASASPRVPRRLQRDEQGVCRPDRHPAVRHRLLPLAARPDLDQGHAGPLRGDARARAGTGSAARSTCAAASRTSARPRTGGCAQNGPLYGWFHPAWAAAGGSLPEPWHFEYAG